MMQILDEETIDLVILDLRLKDEDGMSLARVIARASRHIGHHAHRGPRGSRPGDGARARRR